MKTILTFLLLFCLPLPAVTVTFEWDAPAPADGVTGYRLYERISADGTRIIATTDANTLTASGDFGSGTHEVFVVALGDPGIESPPSDPVSFTVPGKPGTPRIKITLQASDDMETWENIAVVYEPEKERRFYRLMAQRE